MRTAAQFAKYVTVALLSAASDWMAFATLFFTFGSPILAQAISRFAGAVVSFGVNKYWSFQSPQHSRAMIEAWRFLVLFIASYTLALSLFSAFTLWGARPYLAKVVTDTACFFFNFLVMRVWVYRPQGTGMDEESGATSLQSDQHGRSVHWG